MAEVPRNRLPSGYDEEFVNAVEDEVLCLICHLPLKEPVQTRCGHRFCKECLEEHFTRQTVQNQPLTCPADREGVDQDRDVFPDKATERKILSFVIKCPSEGCDWTGELRNKEVHLTSCIFKLVSCTNENCHVSVQRKDLEEHVTITCQWRILECDHCSELYPECKIEDHTSQCSKFPVSCPYNCGDSFPREMIPNHIKDDCPLTIISCPYEQMGCETKVQRKQVESHLQSAVRPHLDLACIKLNDTEVKLNDTEAKLNDTEAKLNDTQKKLDTTTKLVEELNTPVFIWKIDNFSKILREAKSAKKEMIESAPFYVGRTESYGYKLRVKIYPNGGVFLRRQLSVGIIVMKGEYDAILPWPFKKKVTFTLIDQQEDPVQRENVTVQFKPGNVHYQQFARPTQEENLEHGFPLFISHTKLYSRRYIVDDALFLQVGVGP